MTLMSKAVTKKNKIRTDPFSFLFLHEGEEEGRKAIMVFSRAVRTHGRQALNSVLSSHGKCVRNQVNRVVAISHTRNFSAEPALVPGIGRGKTSTGLVRWMSPRC